jgi:glyoxylase-like metal-dependent hydrolase (beta-lactamase superfamily II)
VSDDRKPFFAMPHPGIFRVTCPTPFPGLPHVHVYIAEGEDGGLVLFDTAMPVDDSFERIEQSVRWLDRSLTDIERIYLTHAHPDHFGLAKELQEASGAPVWCHPIAHEGLMSFERGGHWGRVQEEFAQHGWSMEGFEGRSAPFSITIPKHYEHVDEGDRLRFAGGEWDVYWTPGHEHGHVAFHRASDGVMIVGDTLLGKITPHIGYMVDPPDPLGQFMDSLDKLAGLEPSLVLPGHGRPFDEGAERARSIKAHHELRLRRCVETLMHGGSMPGMEVARALFGRELMFFEERLALAETLSHLEYLRLRGRLHRELVDGLWHYELARGVVP